MPTVWKFKIIGFLLFTIHYLLFTIPVHAQTPIQSGQTASVSALPSTISTTSPIYTDLLMHNMFHSISCLILGGSVIGQPCVTYRITQDAQGAIQTIPMLSQTDLSGGVLGTTGSLVGSLYSNPPIRTVEYLGSLNKQLGLVKEANAQVIGSGAVVLNPVLTLWQVSRNIAYIVMIIIFVVIGLMVMFRQRINPQTVITAQSAIPGLIIGLILITFSYFGAALITDTAFIGVDLVGYYFGSAIGSTDERLTQKLKLENVLSIGSPFAGKLNNNQIQNIADQIIGKLEGPQNPLNMLAPQNVIKITLGLMAYQVGAAVGAAGGGLLSAILLATAANPATAPIVAGAAVAAPGAAAVGVGAAAAAAPIAAAVMGPLVGTAFGGIAYAFPAFVLGIALYLAAIFAVLYAIFKLLLSLINTYLAIIFLTVTAPFHFLAASLPGRQGIAVDWARNMLCHILTFPAVIAVFYFAAYLLGNNEIQAFGVNSQLDITSTTGTLPLFGGLDLSFIRVLLAFGAILATPKIPEIVCRAVGKPGASGQLIGQAIDEATGKGQGYSRQVEQGIGGVSGNVKESWRRWKGQDPYYSGARKYETLRGLDKQGKRIHPLRGIFKPEEITYGPYAPPAEREVKS